jgi:class 3 adenylate cyclase
MAALQHSSFCKGCWEQMHLPVPLRGLISAPFRAFGVRPSRMNPNTCTICELMFTKVMRARKITIDATIMFADLRGYTGLSQSQSADAVSGLLDAFYDESASAIWEHDGLLNKTIGDAVMAVFNFPLRRADHARKPCLRRAISRRTGAPGARRLPRTPSCKEALPHRSWRGRRSRSRLLRQRIGTYLDVNRARL